MGYCLLLTSPVRALKTEFPAFKLSVVVESRFAGCFEGNPDFDEVLSIERKTQALRLLARHYDLVINLHGGPTSLAYPVLARGPHIGFEQFQYSWLYRGLLAPPAVDVHSVEAMFTAFRWLGVRQQAPPPLRFEANAEAAKIRAGLRTPYAVIHPAALMETKR